MKQSGALRNRSCSVLFTALLSAGPAGADIPEYQIVRIIAYQTSCTLGELTRREAEGGAVEFHASCENESFYPDGVVLQCPDPDDAYQCVVTTAEREFRFLESLQERADSDD